MPSIAQDDVSLFHTRQPNSDKQEANVDLLYVNTTHTTAENEYKEKKNNFKNNCKNIWLPFSAIILMIIFFVPLVGLMAATLHYGDQYPDVIVTPFSNIYFSNFTGVITAPCYYPASSNNDTATSLCTNVDYQTKYYCPTDYSCLVDASAFAAPYIGCISLTTTCSDLEYCVNKINALPNIDSAAKSLTLSFSPVIGYVLIFGGSFLLTCAGVTLVFYFLTRRNAHTSPVNWLLLNVSCLFIIVSGGFYFSMGVPMDSGDCYSNHGLNNAFDKLSALSLGYLEVYIFYGMFAMLFLCSSLLIGVKMLFRKQEPVAQNI